MPDYTPDFASDSLDFEWAYFIDFEAGVLETWTRIERPLAEGANGRESHLRLLDSVKFDELDEQYMVKLEQKDYPDQEEDNDVSQRSPS